MEGVLDEPDPQVIAAARAGDIGAFEELVRHFQSAVWRLSYHLLHDESLAEDAAQDAFVRAYRFLSRYRGQSKFSTWLFSIARNCALDELRRRGRRRKISESLEAERARPSADPTLGVEVREAVSRLPLELREPIVLIDVLGSSYRDVSKMLNLPEGTIKSRVHRGRQELAARLLPSSELDSREG